MARRKKGEEEVQAPENLQEAMKQLANGTNFTLSSDTQVLTERHKVLTPLEVLNIFLGGGIPFGTVMQSFGPPKGGKSTWMYQMMGIFQKMYDNGIAVIVDTEASADGGRIEFLGVDNSRVLRLPSSSIENGFISLKTLLDNKMKNPMLKDVPVFVIWDTISKGMPQDNTTQSRMLAMDRARVIKGYLNEMMSKIEKHDFILGLINQVIYSTDSYGNRKTDAGGGIALKHDLHFSTFIEISGSAYEKDRFLTRRVSNMTIDKSKISPEMKGIPIVIDVTMGGIIDVSDSLLDYFINLEWIPNKSGWFKFETLLTSKDFKETMNSPIRPLLEGYNKSYYYADISARVKGEPLLFNLLRLILAEFYQGLYSLQGKIIEPYRIEIIKDILNCTSAEIPIWRFEVDDVLYKDTFMKDNPFNPDWLSGMNLEDKFVCAQCGHTFSDYQIGCPVCDCNAVISMKQYVESYQIDDSVVPDPVSEVGDEGIESEDPEAGIRQNDEIPPDADGDPEEFIRPGDEE